MALIHDMNWIQSAIDFFNHFFFLKCGNAYVNVATEHTVPLPDPEPVFPSGIRVMLFLRETVLWWFLSVAGCVYISKQCSVITTGESETNTRFYKTHEIPNYVENCQNQSQKNFKARYLNSWLFFFWAIKSKYNSKIWRKKKP